MEIILLGNKMERKAAAKLESSGLKTKTQIRNLGVFINSHQSFGLFVTSNI